MVLKRVLAKIQVEETLRRGEEAPSDVFLIGMPGYEIMMNDQAFDQNKKNITLTQNLRNSLHEVADMIENDDLWITKIRINTPDRFLVIELSGLFLDCFFKEVADFWCRARNFCIWMVWAEEVCWPVLLWVWWFPLASLYTIVWWCLSPPYRYLFLSVIPLYSAPIPEWLPINWPIFSLAWWSRVHSARCTLLISRALNGRFVVLFRIWSELCRCDFVELCFSFRVRQCIIADWWGSRPDFSFNYKLSKASRAFIHWWHKIIWQNNKLSLES